MPTPADGFGVSCRLLPCVCRPLSSVYSALPQPGERFRSWDPARQERFINRIVDMLADKRCTQVRLWWFVGCFVFVCRWCVCQSEVPACVHAGAAVCESFTSRFRLQGTRITSPPVPPAAGCCRRSAASGSATGASATHRPGSASQQSWQQRVCCRGRCRWRHAF